MALVPIESQAVISIFSILYDGHQTACKKPIQGRIAFKVILQSLFHAKIDPFRKWKTLAVVFNEVPLFPHRWRHHFCAK